MPVETIHVNEPFYVLERPCVLGEAPIYRASDSTLHYVDCLYDPPQLHILSVDPETGDAVYPHGVSELSSSSIDKKNVSRPGFKVLDLEDSVTVQYFRANHPGSYICAYYQGIAFMDEATGKLEVLKEIIPTSERHIRRFNDGAVDCKGRFWAAEIDVLGLANGATNLPENPQGRLWRYDPDGTLTKMEDGLVCGNGLAWSPDNTKMYLNDSVAQTVYSYDFDKETGNISNKQIFISRKEIGGEPDGMVADSEGNLWIAMFHGSSVDVYNPQGEIIKTIKFPCHNMACTTWGGKNNDILYIVTSYKKDGDVVDRGGHVYKYQTNAKGITKYEFAG